jgi:DNA-binding MarR family transcriptional regulator
LAEKGLITQGSDAADRRKQMLALTPEGIDCLRNGVPASLEREKRLRSRLTASEYTSFCRALEMLGDEAQKMHGET